MTMKTKSVLGAAVPAKECMTVPHVRNAMAQALSRLKRKMMINASKLQYFTMAAWMRGYAAHLRDDDEYTEMKLVQKLEKAADMLDAVFSKYTEELGEDNAAD